MTHTLTPEAIALLDAAVDVHKANDDVEAVLKAEPVPNAWICADANLEDAKGHLTIAAIAYARSLEPKEPK